MSEYALPRTDRERIAHMLSDSGRICVHSMDEEPIYSPNARWWRFICDVDTSRAVACVCEHESQPEFIVVHIGTDLRRVPFLWRLPADLRLVRRLSRLLKSHGGRLVPQID
jgi:hypothetical protein